MKTTKKKSTKPGLLIFCGAGLLLAYVSACLTVNRGDLLWYPLVLVFLVGILRKFVSKNLLFIIGTAALWIILLVIGSQAPLNRKGYGLNFGWQWPAQQTDGYCDRPLGSTNGFPFSTGRPDWDLTEYGCQDDTNNFATALNAGIMSLVATGFGLVGYRSFAALRRTM